MSPPFVLMYHSVFPLAGPVATADPHRVIVTPERFAAQMAWLRRRGLRGVSMRVLLAAAAGGRPTGLVGLTFDDGYADFATHALPVLAGHGFGATAFVVAGRLGGHNDWDRGQVPRPLMDADQVRDVHAAGIEIGSHGLRHRHLGEAGSDVLGAEVRLSKTILEELLGDRVRGFCYPYGEYGAGTVATVAAAGYDYAMATWPTARRHRLALPRTYVGDRDGPGRLAAKRWRHALTWAGGRR